MLILIANRCQLISMKWRALINPAWKEEIFQIFISVTMAVSILMLCTKLITSHCTKEFVLPLFICWGYLLIIWYRTPECVLSLFICWGYSWNFRTVLYRSEQSAPDSGINAHSSSILFLLYPHVLCVSDSEERLAFLLIIHYIYFGSLLWCSKCTGSFS